MKVRDLRTIAFIVAAVVLMTAGITAAAVAGIVLAVTVGTLILFYAVRHEARSAHLYHRDD